jgi:hypothetical protein
MAVFLSFGFVSAQLQDSSNLRLRRRPMIGATPQTPKILAQTATVFLNRFGRAPASSALHMKLPRTLGTLWCTPVVLRGLRERAVGDECAFFRGSGINTGNLGKPSPDISVASVLMDRCGVLKVSKHVSLRHRYSCWKRVFCRQ